MFFLRFVIAHTFWIRNGSTFTNLNKSIIVSLFIVVVAKLIPLHISFHFNKVLKNLNLKFLYKRNHEKNSHLFSPWACLEIHCHENGLQEYCIFLKKCWLLIEFDCCTIYLWLTSNLFVDGQIDSAVLCKK